MIGEGAIAASSIRAATVPIGVTWCARYCRDCSSFTPCRFAKTRLQLLGFYVFRRKYLKSRDLTDVSALAGAGWSWSGSAGAGTVSGTGAGLKKPLTSPRTT